MMDSKNIKTKAEIIAVTDQLRDTLTTRGGQHGDMHNNFYAMSAILNILLRDKLKSDRQIDPTDAALILLCLKIARLSTKRTYDSCLDAAGYAAIAAIFNKDSES